MVVRMDMLNSSGLIPPILYSVLYLQVQFLKAFVRHLFSVNSVQPLVTQLLELSNITTTHLLWSS